MGGLLCLLYQAFSQDKNIKNTVTVASPIDLSVGKGMLSSIASMTKALDGPVKLVSKLTHVEMKNVKARRFSLPNWLTTMIFRLTDPVGRVTTYWDLLTRLGDRDFVESHTTTSNYLNNMLRYPGGVVKEITASMIDEQQMPSGKLKAGEKIAYLSNINSNLLVFAGDRDNLVPAETADKILKFATSKDSTFLNAAGGHMGVILGSSSPKDVWEPSANWLKTRSI